MPSRSLVDKILPQLEDILLASSRTPNKPHSERSLSERLGVSRPIIREALRSLRQRGLVEIVPGKGIFPSQNIHQPTVMAMQDYLRRKEVGFPALLDGRLFLETRTAALAAENRTKTDIAALAATVYRMEQALNDASEFEQADLDFHLQLAASTGNELYLIWLQPIIGMLEERRNRVVTLGEVRSRALESHRHIFEAVKASDADMARTEMEKHLHAFDMDTKLAIRLGLLPPDEKVRQRAS